MALETFSFAIHNKAEEWIPFLAGNFKIPQTLKHIVFDYSHQPETNGIILEKEQPETRSLEEVTSCVDYLLKTLSKDEGVNVTRLQFFFRGPVNEEVTEKAFVKYSRRPVI